MKPILQKIAKEIFCRSVFVAVGLAIIFRSLLFDNFHVPSGSMIPTLLEGDRLSISKMSYGYSRYSFPFGLIPFSGRVMQKDPKRGDIIVFKLPNNTRVNYVKRLIGMPGDTIQVSGGLLYINNKPVQISYVGSFEEGGARVDEFIETLPNGVKHKIQERTNDGPADNTAKFLVPPNHYFFMGDNRDNSRDSRFKELGFVHEKYLLGKVKIIFLSTPGSILNPVNWFKVRKNRFFLSPHKQS